MEERNGLPIDQQKFNDFNNNNFQSDNNIFIERKNMYRKSKNDTAAFNNTLDDEYSMRKKDFQSKKYDSQYKQGSKAFFNFRDRRHI